MEKVQSNDGTLIGYDQIGEGRPIVLVGGASCDRSVGAPIAEALARDFTVLNYDRRGRGDSGDTMPYSIGREIEDIEALLAAAGGSASLLGLSSGAVLAAAAAARRLPVNALVMWEPPFSIDDDGRRRVAEYAERLAELLADGRRDDAVVLFMRLVGMPEEMIAGARQSPYWQATVGLADTLAYDAEIMGDGSVPVDMLRGIAASTIVLAGAKSPDPLKWAAEATAAAIPGARFEVLDGQDHNVAGEAIAPVVAAFAR